ncbi:hypothetical protein DFQ01_1506 [Paenibacillus cellulosilyticus]|uniref:Uncharacterized protein n=1 Tax=Paenibacillus cellulosilyticus TaxID=375489 RepID=A0A2V2YDH6_9BACL|nr:hypothetical protein [Paenibacillus cellulosilyticus]PWV88457.1 hypothetical protein DFQ01_1506 [Paenibacillus cellulosilyticus]QKS44093.1 hypothetical protein HUB94_06365 [Paenibacillus cellulosilyticus]
MKITCHYGEYADMGYVYIAPPNEKLDRDIEHRNEITKQLKPQEIHIPYITGNSQIALLISKMTISKNTFKTGYQQAFESEYGYDFDSRGYLTGFELSLSQDKFIEFIRNQAYKVFHFEWHNKLNNLVTFDYPEEVFHSENIIYKMNEQEDTFVIVQLEEDEDLYSQYSYTTKKNPPTAKIKALFSSREDIYPLEFLLKPKFQLEKSIPLAVINNDLCCEMDVLPRWESIAEEKRERLINQYTCENCSEVVSIVQCIIHGEADGFLLMGKCSSCRQGVESYVLDERRSRG